MSATSVKNPTIQTQNIRRTEEARRLIEADVNQNINIVKQPTQYAFEVNPNKNPELYYSPLQQTISYSTKPGPKPEVNIFRVLANLPSYWKVNSFKQEGWIPKKILIVDTQIEIYHSSTNRARSNKTLMILEFINDLTYQGFEFYTLTPTGEIMRFHKEDGFHSFVAYTKENARTSLRAKGKKLEEWFVLDDTHSFNYALRDKLPFDLTEFMITKRFMNIVEAVKKNENTIILNPTILRLLKYDVLHYFPYCKTIWLTRNNDKKLSFKELEKFIHNIKEKVDSLEIADLDIDVLPSLKNTKIEHLRLMNLPLLKNIEGLPSSLTTLSLSGLDTLTQLLNLPDKFSTLYLNNCISLKTVEPTPIRELRVDYCPRLSNLREILQKMKEQGGSFETSRLFYNCRLIQEKDIDDCLKHYTQEKIKGKKIEEKYKSSGNHSSSRSASLAHREIDTNTYTSFEKIINTRYKIYYYEPTKNIFKSISADFYRETILDEFIIKEGKLSLVKENSTPPVISISEKKVSSLAQVLHTIKLTEYYYRFMDRFEVSAQWESLPGYLHCNEILFFECSENVELRYNLETQQNEIRLESLPDQGTREISLDFLFILGNNTASVPKPPELDILIEKQLDLLFASLGEKSFRYCTKMQRFKRDKNTIFPLSNKLEQKKYTKKIDFCQNKLATYFKEFQNSELNSNLNLTPYIELMHNIFNCLLQKKGACRHRAFLYTLLCHYMGVPARFISNGTHAYTEIFTGSYWEKQDLGGSQIQSKYENEDILQVPASAQETKTSEIIETVLEECFQPPAPAQETKTSEIIETVLEECFQPPAPQWIEECSHAAPFISHLLSRRSVFLRANSLEETRSIYHEIHKNIPYKNNAICIYVEKPDDIIYLKNMININAQGDIKHLLGPFYENREIYFIINFSRFNPTQIATYKTVFDDYPKLNGMELGQNIKVIGMIANKTVTSEDFDSRCQKISIDWPKKFALQPQIFPLSGDTPPVTSESLYGENWFEKLVGDIVVVPSQQFKNEFKPGLLVQAAENNLLELNLHNAPFHNEDFLCFLHNIERKKSFYANGILYKLSPEFVMRFYPGSRLELACQTELNLSPSELNTCYVLNKFTFSYLFPYKNIDGSENKGYLSSYPETTILLTENLPQAQQDELRDEIKKFDYKVKFVHIGKLIEDRITQSRPEHLVISSGATIFETWDPNVKTGELVKEYNIEPELIFDITEQMDWSIFFEYKEQISTHNNLMIDVKTQKILQAILDGKKVLFTGNLSYEMYLQLETLFFSSPYLSLFGKRNSIENSLFIVTRPLDYKTPMATLMERRTFTANTNLEAAAVTLKKEFKSHSIIDKIMYYLSILSSFIFKNSQKPNQLPINLALLKNTLKYLEKSEYGEENPLKRILQKFDKESEVYCYLNVLGKIIFAPESSQTASLSFKKVNTLNWEEKLDFRHLNCFPSSQCKIWGEKYKFLQLAQKESNIFKLPFNLQNEIKSFISKLEPKINSSFQKSSYDKKLERTLEVFNHYFAVTLKGSIDIAQLAVNEIADKLQAKIFSISLLKEWLTSTNGRDNNFLILEPADIDNSEVQVIINALIRAQLNKFDPTHTFVNYQEQLFPLTPNHKIILLSNAQKKKTILREIPTVHFSSLSDNELMEKIVLPILKNHPIKNISENNIKTCVEFLVQGFQIATQHLTKGSLSTQDLKQAVARFTHRIKKIHQEQKSSFKEAAVQTIIEELSVSFINENNKNNFIQEFCRKINYSYQAFNPQNPIFINLQEKGFYVPENRKLPINLLQENILLQEKKILDLHNNKKPLPTKNATLFEGASGTGKTTLCIKTLEHMGYTRINEQELEAAAHIKSNKKLYFHFTLGSPSTNETVLENAFQAGIVVIIDELNLDPSIEKLLTPMLTEKRQPRFPGFYIVCSQNDSSFAGRYSLTNEFKNNFCYINVNEYNKEELLEVTQQRFSNLSPKHCEVVVEKYLKSKRTNSDLNDRVFFESLDKLAESLKLQENSSKLKMEEGNRDTQNKNDFANEIQLTRVDNQGKIRPEIDRVLKNII